MFKKKLHFCKQMEKKTLKINNYYHLVYLSTQKLINSKTYKLRNSKTYKLRNSKTHNFISSTERPGAKRLRSTQFQMPRTRPRSLNCQMS